MVLLFLDILHITCIVVLFIRDTIKLVKCNIRLHDHSIVVAMAI